MGRRAKLGCSSERGVSPDEGGILLQRRLGGAQRRLTRRWARNSVLLGGRASPSLLLAANCIGTSKTSKLFYLTYSLGAARPPNENSVQKMGLSREMPIFWA